MYLFLKHAEMDEFKSVHKKSAYQVSGSNKYTPRATLHRQGEFPLVPKRLLSFTTSGLCVWGTGWGGHNCLVLNFTLLLPTMVFWRPWILHDLNHVFSQPLSFTLNSCISKEEFAKWLVPFLKLYTHMTSGRLKLQVLLYPETTFFSKFNNSSGSNSIFPRKQSITTHLSLIANGILKTETWSQPLPNTVKEPCHYSLYFIPCL